MASQKNYPHPVLDPSGSDYPSCAVQFRSTMTATPTHYRFRIGFDLGSTSLLEAINHNHATFAVQVDCRWTSFRTLSISAAPEWEFLISEDKLRGAVLLKPLIIATRDFVLRSQEFSELFRHLDFNVSKGFILGWDNPIEFEAEKWVDSLKNLAAILTVVRSRKPFPFQIEYGLTGEKIEVHLTDRDYQHYSELKSNAAHRHSLMFMIALPAIAKGIQFLREKDPADQSPSRWERVLTRRVAELPPNIAEDPWVAAQVLLDFPFSRALDGIVAVEEAE